MSKTNIFYLIYFISLIYVPCYGQNILLACDGDTGMQYNKGLLAISATTFLTALPILNTYQNRWFRDFFRKQTNDEQNIQDGIRKQEKRFSLNDLQFLEEQENNIPLVSFEKMVTKIELERSLTVRREDEEHRLTQLAEVDERLEKEASASASGKIAVDKKDNTGDEYYMLDALDSNLKPKGNRNICSDSCPGIVSLPGGNGGELMLLA